MKQAENIINKSKPLLLISLAVAVYFPIFHNIGQFPIWVWDEALFGLRALHLHEFGTYMTNFNEFENIRSHINTKLPFTTWLQVICFKIFGVSEFSLRLPIALIFLGTSALVTYFFKKKTNSWYPGIFFILILLSSTGFVKPHFLRTGDQDVPFACYILLSILCFCDYEMRKKWVSLIGFGLFLLAALLTKNIFALFIGPGIILFGIWQKSLIQWLKDLKIWACIVATSVLFLSVILDLENGNPGMWERIWEYELLGRYTRTIEGHQGDFFHYYRLLFRDFSYVWILIPLSFLLGFFDIGDKRKLISRALTCCFISASLILSFSSTKTEWYHAQLQLILVLQVSIFIDFMISYFANSSQQKLLISLALICSFAIPYSSVIAEINSDKSVFQEANIKHLISQVESDYPETKRLIISENNFGATSVFYAAMYNIKQNGIEVSFQRPTEFHEGDLVATCMHDVMNFVKENFNYSVIINESYVDGCKLVRLESKL